MSESLEKYKSELEQACAVAANEDSSTVRILPFDAVILNHTVSYREDGLQAAKEILLANPHQRIVFVSDSVQYTVELQNELYDRVEIIQKPFEPEALVELLESTEVYRALGSLGLNVQKLKECNLNHSQLLELLDACMTLLEEKTGN
jgi:DNA-binding LytR/AlgR family response regulator